MKEAIQEKKFSLSGLLNGLLSFSLSAKFKFAVKASLSVMLAYLISFAQGWENGSIAAITIMLIAVAGPVSQSVIKGLRRVIGTIIGAVIGMLLIAVFPQDRMYYLFFLSLFVTISLYLTRAYKGDMTVFMLTAVTMMMVFNNGNVDESFLYGVDKTFMTIFGIAVFTFVSIFLWPEKAKEDTVDIAGDLLQTQLELYRKRDGEKAEKKKIFELLQMREEALKNSVINAASESESLSRSQRNTILQNMKEIDETLMLLSYHDEAHFAGRYSDYVSNFNQADKEIRQLFVSLKSAMNEKKEIVNLPAEWKESYDDENTGKLSHIDRAALTAVIIEIKKLHRQLRDLADKFNAILSPYPTHFELSKLKSSSFNWFDIEDMKGALVTFLIFWTSVIFWIFVNPPAGFLIVTLATALSVLTTYSPLKPSLLIILFTFSFIFATAMYILVLPNIHYGWELGLFISFYSFIGFYFINPQIAIFFLLGMIILGLSNPMFYNFQVFLMILLVFYLFLFILLLFYYIPFSTKPEMLFLTMKRRFFRLSSNLLKRSNTLLTNKDAFSGRLKAWYAQKHLMNTVMKMQLWAGKIDTKYFDTLEQKTLLEFTKECETFAYLLQMMYKEEAASAQNRLVQRLREEKNDFELVDLLTQYARNMDTKEIDSRWKEGKKIIDSIEQHLEEFFSQMKPDQYSREEFVHFYELLALRRSVWVSFFNCQSLMEKLDFNILKRSRF